MPASITVKNISKDFRDDQGKILPALENINLKITPGEFFILLGPSGCGKSTLLRIMSGLEKDFEGQVLLSKGLTALDFSFVFQQFALLPWLTVSQNIELGLVARDISPHKRYTIVERELKQFKLEQFGRHFPHELSGGMKQRVGIARALATEPKIIFMDEPFSALDSFIAKELREELLQVWQQRKPTIVMVTHNIQEALELGDRIAVMTPRPGKIEKVIQNPLSRPRPMRSKEIFDLEDQLYKLIKP